MGLLPANCRYAIERDQQLPTASCSIIFDKYGDVKLQLANMDINQTISPQMVSCFLRCKGITL